MLGARLGARIVLVSIVFKIYLLTSLFVQRCYCTSLCNARGPNIIVCLGLGQVAAFLSE